MKTIGLIGGMSWESTVTYYQILNQRVNAALGGYHSAKMLLYNVDFAEVEAAQRAGDWRQVGELLADAARRLELGGADFVLLGTNTMHKSSAAIEAVVSIPFVHIADATAEALATAYLDGQLVNEPAGCAHHHDAEGGHEHHHHCDHGHQ